ncbi:N-acyl-D-amino-acid deacylase family protein [Cognaticolwellia beringensis]|uniref:Amidohydrolase n=1 Tax=Cognaticolwellia beringensis TaxID=1967665 RepID=A0A222GB37_9GAMM|nr:amidohydrolase family protein [Cognaticolwellia beringensis]ASP48584.1 amidohydrolase [Cognaticolwellia beringensis]
MKNFNYSLFACLITTTILTSCSSEKSIQAEKGNTPEVDILIVNGTVYTGELRQAQSLNIAVCKQTICGVYPKGKKVNARKVIDASGKIVSPGFIDPHTHSLADLLSQDKKNNLNYLTQGVTTVVNGNDGGGPVDIKSTTKQLLANGIGNNVALYIGHGSIREQVMGREQRFATEEELTQMKALMAQAMKDGAIGLSSGLYYVPGSYSNTQEVVLLAEIAAQYNGVYDTHIRDESTFNIGFLGAVDEAINIAKEAGIHLNLSHIKALGVDVWGQSEAAVAKIERAKKQGVSISADQYPWLASGTKLHSAVMPKWVMADSQDDFFKRLNDPILRERLHNEIKENIRRRGGSESLLVTAFKDQGFVGLTLKDIATMRNENAITTAIKLVQEGEVRVASFNMSDNDVEYFMQLPWVVTSSDGTDGHPRKYASFPQKYQEYVLKKKILTVEQFIYQSSTRTAKILKLDKRGKLSKDYYADIIIFDPETFKANADFSHWNKLSTGVEHVIVNGVLVIENEQYLNKLSGKFVN